MSDNDAGPKAVEVYFNEDGSVSGVHVLLDVIGHFGKPVWLEFEGKDVALSAVFPDDAGTVHDDFTAISSIVLPEKPLPKEADVEQDD